ncbi:SACE_7040 family transcriptional regulator [Microbacterium sp. No. 7]|uniref:SACE_7040 family transcriptional regulator n=1 Tax=Microbacterium sp. No. 7 TaxID=1714373 RepID=UPI0006D1EF6C|nr:TetR/AcrR family transcriptional regulator [Microbacterium sp. No. 7]ALJ18639.1 TetR family transcriptional regulator [Microbacterium sp. No. 7]
MTSELSTDRGRAKADRRAGILQAAARLFAERGYNAVSLEDIGGAVGVSGPAIYRHFANKQALLGAILVSVSEGLLAGGLDVLERESSPPRRLEELVRFHVDFALADVEVIRVQDRELSSLGDDDRHTVRRLQREYVELWTGVLHALRPDRSVDELRVRAHACFGLLNSTPHSTRPAPAIPDDATARRVLEQMALAALRA